MAIQLRTLFLREFTRGLIINSKTSSLTILPFHPVRTEEKPVQLVVPRTKEIAEHQEIKNIRFMPPEMQHKIIAKTTATFQPKTLIEAPTQIPVQNQIIPSPMPLPEGFSLEKLDILIRDNRVTSIECSGPGKPILVKILGKVNSTQIVLSEEEIKKIINNFARYAKIPALGGVFKAAVGNLIITSVISDFVGSRFIINKYTPYSLLEQNPQFPSEMR